MPLTFDGTLTRTTDAILELINYKFECKLTAYDLRQWDWWAIPHIADIGIREKDFWDAFDIIHRNGWTDMLKTYDKDTLRVIRRLADKHEVVILSAKAERHLPTISSWLRKNFIYNIPVIDHSSVEGMSSVKKLSFDWECLIDDAPHIAEAMIDGRGGNRTMLLLDSPWNRSVIVPEGNVNVVRKSGWSEVEKLFFP